ncbi:MAG: ice-binding family protein, partial [Nitrosotalea sp.]
MIKTNITSYFIISVLVLSALSFTQNNAFATSAIDLGTAKTFGILASTYTNSASTSITGNLGYTTGPAVNPVVSGSTFVAPNSTYSQAGTDQNTAISVANSLACTSNLGSTVDLSSDTIHGSIGVYAPGVYCTTGATSTGTGITLTGNGDHIFKIGGSLNTVAGTSINLSGGALANDVYWVPVGATTLGATSNFTGNILDATGVTIGTTVTMTGRVLAFGGTITTTADTITVPSVAPVTLVSIAITHPATKLSYTVGDALNTTGLVVTGTFSDASTSVVTPTSVTGFNSSAPVTGQV